MNAIWSALKRFLRASPLVNALMRRLGIDSVHYWLLVDLFGTLSDRREFFSHFGRDAMSLQKSSWLFYFLSGVMTLVCVGIGMTPQTYFLVFMALSSFLLLTTLLAETNNSLMNPVEGLVLAHQPINGATYTSAKLTHILRVLLYLVPALNLIPACAGLLLPGAPWYYPLLHLTAAFAVGLVMALFCCALFGWLIRFVPPARLKAVGFAAEMSSWLLYVSFQFAPRLHLKLRVPQWLPAGPGPRAAMAVALSTISLGIMALGLRVLSGDYLARVAAIAHGGSGRKIRVRRSYLGAWAARLCGGPTVRAGFEFVSRMMLRDWQFRRQMINLIPLTLILFAAVWDGRRTSPFSAQFTAAQFTAAQFLPHAFGIAFFLVCIAMPFGNDYKGAWLFLLAPAGAFRGVARGVYARLLTLVLIPHLILLPFLAWHWGARDAALFLGYSAAVSAVYLALELRRIDCMPFTRQPEGANNTDMLGVLMLGGLSMAVAVALQYFLVFRSRQVVLSVTAALCVAAWLLTRSSLGAFEIAIRFHLGLLSNESKGIYTEVDG
jgi:hypothetical protein